jgi:hypothetical protein
MRRRLTPFVRIEQTSRDSNIQLGYQYIFMPIHDGTSKANEIGHYKLAFLNIVDAVVGLYDPLRNSNMLLREDDKATLGVS